MPNKYGVPEEKWPTVRWLINQGFEDSILIEVKSKKKNKGTFVRNGVKYMYNNDAADSAGIAMFGFVGEGDKLKEEKWRYLLGVARIVSRQEGKLAVIQLVKNS